MWEKRDRYWIYEAFYLDGTVENDIIKAVESGEAENIRKLTESKCYVDLYTTYKDEKDPSRVVTATLLYQAVDKAQVDVVEALLCGGADRNVWSSEKQTAVQLLANKLQDPKCSKQQSELLEIEELFNMHYKNKFRRGIRKLMPIDKFQIGVMDTKDPKVEAFKTKFDHLITKNLSKMTHMVLPVDEKGVLNLSEFSFGEKLDNLNLAAIYYVVCSPVILVKPSWLPECLKIKKHLRQDYEHRITKVYYNKKEYLAVDGWKEWARKFAIPYLHNIDVAYYAPEGSPHKENGYFEKIVKALGGTWKPVAEVINGASKRTSNPYWLPKFSRHWIVHKEEYTTQVDDELKKPCYVADDLQCEFTMMTVEAFFEMMLDGKGPNGFDPTKKPGSFAIPIAGSTHKSSRTSVTEVTATSKKTE